MHKDVLKGYRASRGMFLYKGDTVMTLEKSRVRFRMNDGSILSLASETKLKLNKTVHDKKKKSRSSFLSLALGKARFFVVKLLDYKRSEFRVRTPTAVCGVRGSDFILEATALETIATALEETALEFRGLAFLEEPPIIIRDFETSIAKLDQRPTKVFKLPMDTINRKKDLFIDITPEEADVTDDDLITPGKADDDTGVDEIGELGDEMNLDDFRPTEFLGTREYDDYLIPIKPLTPPSKDKYEDVRNEGGLPGDLPNFPDLPQ
jgi:hypothetical protein